MGKQSRLRAVRRAMTQVDTALVRIQLTSSERTSGFAIGQAVAMAGVHNIPRSQRKQRMYVAAIDEENGVITLTHDAPPRFRECSDGDPPLPF